MMASIRCSTCPRDATVKISDAHSICSRCFEILKREYSNFPLASSAGNNVAAAANPSPAKLAAVTTNSDISIPAFLRRDANNVPAFARAS
jgi:hypothetical protein